MMGLRIFGCNVRAYTQADMVPLTYVCMIQCVHTCTHVHMLYVVLCSTHKAAERSHLACLVWSCYHFKYMGFGFQNPP